MIKVYQIGELPYSTESNMLENTINEDSFKYWDEGIGGVQFVNGEGVLIILPYTNIKRIEKRDK